MTERALKPGWKVWRFDQIATSIAERVEPGDTDAEYYVGLEHLDSDSLKIRRWGKPSDVEATKLLFRKGDIIFGRRRVYQRKLSVAEFDGICSAHAMVLRPKTDAVLPKFLPFFMQSDLFMNRALEISVGSLSPTINWRTLARQEFALPPLAEQRRVVKVLETAEESLHSLIDARGKAILLWRSLSRQEFGTDKVSFDEKLDKHYTIVSGQVNPEEDVYADLPLIAPNHIESGTGEILELETAREQSAISGKYLFEAGAVLYSKIRPNLVNVTIAPCRGLCSADMYALIPEPSLRREYLLEILLSDRFTQFAVSGSMRTGMPKINRDHLVRYKCRVPSLSEQDTYLESALAVRNARVIISGRIDVANGIKKSILREVWGQ